MDLEEAKGIRLNFGTKSSRIGTESVVNRYGAITCLEGTLKKILIVDDSALARRELIQALDCPEYRVLDAESGIDALAIFAEDPTIDLVISDQNMPGMDGVTLCERLHELYPNAGFKFIICSTEGSDAMKLKGKEVGVAAWAVKPIKAAAVAKTVAVLLAPKRKS